MHTNKTGILACAVIEAVQHQNSLTPKVKGCPLLEVSLGWQQSDSGSLQALPTLQFYPLQTGREHTLRNGAAKATFWIPQDPGKNGTVLLGEEIATRPIFAQRSEQGVQNISTSQES